MARPHRVLVIGLGRFGRAVAEGVVEGGGEAIGVDTDMALVEAVRDRITVAAQVDVVEVDQLREIGAAEVDAAVVAIGEDFAAEVLTVALLKELAIPTIIARAQTERQRRILELVGATRVVAVEAETGERLARALTATDVVDHISLGGDVSIAYWTADERAVGMTLAATGLDQRWHLRVVAVRAEGAETLQLSPDPDYVVRAGDVLLLLGPDSRLAAFTR